MGSAPERSSLDHDALREIVEGTSAETGEAFFDGLVRHLARAVGTKCAWVTEWLSRERHLRALSFWVGDRFFGDFEYEVSGTPCEEVVRDLRLVHVPDRLVEQYAADSSLKSLGGVSYIGVPLPDTDGGLLGHLAVLHDTPMPETGRVLPIFRIFAARAGAELRRLRRDRDLRDREQELTRLDNERIEAEARIRALLSETARLRAEIDAIRSFDEIVGTSAARGRILTAGELRDLERANLLRALVASGWKVSGASGAAHRLGMNANTLSSRMKALGIRRPSQRGES